MSELRELVMEINKDKREFHPPEDKSGLGWCSRIENVVKTHRPNSHYWHSLIPTHHGDFLNHYVGVFGVRGTKGVILQWSGENKEDQKIILGHVPDINKVEQVKTILERVTGRIGWVQEY